MMARDTTDRPLPDEATIHHVGVGNLAEHAARRLVAEAPGARLSALPAAAPAPADGVILAEIGDEVTCRRLCRWLGTEGSASAPMVAIVPDHAAGLAVTRGGAAGYVLAADVDGPALTAAMVAALRGRPSSGRAAAPLFASGTDEDCLSAPAFLWMLGQTTSALRRRGEVGYLLLARVLPPTGAAVSGDDRERLAAAAARRLAGTIRGADVPARIGGLLFAVIVEVGLSLDGANALAGRLTRRLSEPYPLGGRRIAARVAFGMTTVGGDTAVPEDAIARARDALEESLFMDHRHG